MRQRSLFLILISTLILAGCGSSVDNGQPESQKVNLAPEATADQGRHGYWGDPDVTYVAEVVPKGGELSSASNALVSIRDVPRLETAFIDTAPRSGADGIATGKLGIDGGDKDAIVALAQEIADGQHGKINSLLIAHKGKLVFESYYRLGRANLSTPQASATKTYTSLLLGRAIQLGHLTMADLDKPLISLLEGLDPEQFVDGAEQVTLRHALTMRSGVRISDEQAAHFENNPNETPGRALVQAIFEKSEPITAENLSTFSYGNFSDTLVMQVVDAVVPGTAKAFIKDELLGKLGITTYGWLPDLGGLPAGGWKSSFTPRNMMKFGTLAMNKGQWNGEQIIPQAFMDEAMSRIITLGDDDIYGGGKNVSNAGYGYFWWNADLKSGDQTYYGPSVQGGGGQFIIPIDALDLIVVFTGYEREPKNLQITAERILPAFAD